MTYYKEQLAQEKERSALMSVELDGCRAKLGEAVRSEKEVKEKLVFNESKTKELMKELEHLKFQLENTELDESLTVGFPNEYEEKLRALEDENASLKAQLASTLVEELHA
jgi:chromosome segregation ATPase